MGSSHNHRKQRHWAAAAGGGAGRLQITPPQRLDTILLLNTSFLGDGSITKLVSFHQLELQSLAFPHTYASAITLMINLSLNITYEQSTAVGVVRYKKEMHPFQSQRSLPDGQVTRDTWSPGQGSQVLEQRHQQGLQMALRYWKKQPTDICQGLCHVREFMLWCR